MPNEQERKKILKKEGIAIFAEDMRSLNREALAEKLASRNSGRIVLMKLITVSYTHLTLPTNREV